MAGPRAASIVAGVAGLIVTASAAALALRAPRDSSAPGFAALIGGLIAALAALVLLHRARLGSTGRVGRAASGLAMAAPAGIGLGLGAAAISAWTVAPLLFVLGLISFVAAAFVGAGSLLQAGRLRSRGPILLAWGTLALFLFEPWSQRAVAAVPVGLAWLLIGWDAAAVSRGSNPAAVIEGERSLAARSSGRAAMAAALGVATLVAAAGLLGLARFAGRPAGIPGPAPSAAVIPVVIDTDSLPDDWVAITYLLAHPRVDVRAITVSGSSVLGCGDATRQVLRLLALAGRTEIPVACGRPTPAAADHWFPAGWRPGVEQLTTEIPLPEPASVASAAPAVEVLAAAITDSPSPVTVVALGPLTNVADVLAVDAAAKARIAELVVMGGAVDVGGNVGGDNPAAEWNIFVDPEAANAVLRSGVAVTLVALDATGDLPVTTTAVQHILDASPATNRSHYVGRLLAAYAKSFPELFFWDPFAAAVATDRRLAGFQERRLGVTTGADPGTGRVVPAPDGGVVQLATSGDAQAFERTLLATLVGAAP